MNKTANPTKNGWNRLRKNNCFHKEVMAMMDRLGCKIGPLGARWGLLIACEIKYQRKADRRLVITPSLDPRRRRAPGKVGHRSVR